jgi:hypothetical protein
VRIHPQHIEIYKLGRSDSSENKAMRNNVCGFEYNISMVFLISDLLPADQKGDYQTIKRKMGKETDKGYNAVE